MLQKGCDEIERTLFKVPPVSIHIYLPTIFHVEHGARKSRT